MDIKVSRLKEDAIYDPHGFIWAITIAGVIAALAATCAVLYVGAVRAGLGRRRATLLAGGAAVVFGGWFAASAVIAGHGWYHTRLGHGVPWMPVAVVGFLGPAHHGAACAGEGFADPDDRAASGAEPGRCRAQPVTAPGWVSFGLSRLSPPGRPGGLWPGRRASHPAPTGRAERRRR